MKARFEADGDVVVITGGANGIGRALADAVRWKLIAANPASGVRVPRSAPSEMTVWTSDEARRFLDAVTAMGYGLVITELDVRDNRLPVDPVPRDQAVADFTRGYLDLMFAYPGLRDVLLWGMSDRYSWIEGFEPRTDGARRRPCPYDADFAPKPMRAAIAAAIAAAPVRG